MKKTFEERLAASDFTGGLSLKDTLRNRLRQEKGGAEVVRFRPLDDDLLDGVAAAGEEADLLRKETREP